MKSLIFKISLAFALACPSAMLHASEAKDSLMSEVQDTLLSEAKDSMSIVSPLASADSLSVQSRYDKRVHRYRKYWGALVPTQLVVQTCGNMGLFSLGIGWDYGKRGQWETQLLFGFVPKYDSNSAKITMTLKENYTPWSIALKKGWAFEPLECGLYFNTVFGHDFWTKQPTKYESGYYPFSTRIRPNIFLGERITKDIPKNKRKFIKSFTFYYEISTNDIYVMRLYHDNFHAEFWDIFGLSFGLKAQLF